MGSRSRIGVGLLLALAMLMVSCSTARSEGVGSDEQHWDSAQGNPTHPTHSTMAELAVKTNRAELPELVDFEAKIVEGANLELHELPLRGNSQPHEALRLEVGGTNWAADRPEVLWSKAKASYQAGNKGEAYFYVGIMLHYVQDMGVPAHAFHVIHQSSARNWDHLELLGFFDFHADMRTPTGNPDPNLEDPIQYIEWSAEMARNHFKTSFPGAEYHRKYFPQAYADMTDEHWAFLRRREADCVWATAFALRSAGRALQSLPPQP